jgi:hypothetical protein
VDYLGNTNHLGISARCARWILLAAQRSRFRGVGGYSPEAFAARKVTAPFPQALREASFYGEFFEYFRGTFDAEAAIRKRTVLDFGCGYGGSTVEYARLGGPASSTALTRLRGILRWLSNTCNR